jgi:hypothetical protein
MTPKPLDRACNRSTLVTTPDMTLHDAAQRLLDRQVARLVVMDGAAIAGLIPGGTSSVCCSTPTQNSRSLSVPGSLQNTSPRLKSARGEGFVYPGRWRDAAKCPDRFCIEAIDGVIGMDSELGWKEGDVSRVPSTRAAGWRQRRK